MTQHDALNDPAVRARDVLQAAMLLACEVALDLDVTWDEARELFADTLFALAEERHGVAAQTAASLGTSLRTAQNYRRRHREPPTLGLFNMRRRVLQLLEQGPQSLEALEGKLPLGSDMNFAKSALKSLVSDGVVVFDRKLRRYRRSNPDYMPWYVHARDFPSGALRAFFRHMGRQVGSRCTPRIEEGAEPASMFGLALTIPQGMQAEFAAEVYGALSDLEAAWRARAHSATPEDPGVLVSCEAVFGRLHGTRHDDESLADLSGAVWGTTIR